MKSAPEVMASSIDRCTIQAGDFFRSVPTGGDVYTLSQILHDWSDERCLEILATCRPAMQPGARLRDRRGSTMTPARTRP